MPKMNHECGICAVYSKKEVKINAFKKAVNILSFLQHRGQDSCGISYIDKSGKTVVFKALGLIKDNLFNLDIDSKIAIAHTRYATSGGHSLENAQPYFYNDASLCFNGTIYKSKNYRKILTSNGFSFETTSDAEIILKWIFYKTNKNPSDWKMNEIKEILNNDFKNSGYSILILLKDRIFAFKDIFSYRPLVFIETKEAFCFSSEDYAIKDEIIKKIELKNGQGVEISENGVIFSDDNTGNIKKQCVFEVIYFANRNSNVFNTNVKNARIRLGQILARDDDIEIDCVIPVMNSGFWGAFGYSKAKGAKLSFAIKNNTNILRTFIEKEEKRNIAVDEKYSIKINEIKGKNIVVVDDSIVRGTTMKKITALIKNAGAKKIHIRLTSPKIINACFWGVDIPNKNELFANKFQFDIMESMAKDLGADSVKFIPLEAFEDEFKKDIWCYNCFMNTITNPQE